MCNQMWRFTVKAHPAQRLTSCEFWDAFFFFLLTTDVNSGHRSYCINTFSTNNSVHNRLSSFINKAFRTAQPSLSGCSLFIAPTLQTAEHENPRRSEVSEMPKPLRLVWAITPGFKIIFFPPFCCLVWILTEVLDLYLLEFMYSIVLLPQMRRCTCIPIKVTSEGILTHTYTETNTHAPNSISNVGVRNQIHLCSYNRKISFPRL